MAEFIFMLTHGDATVANALAVYDQIRELPLMHVGFKDVGAPPSILKRLTERIHQDGRTAYLEVVSVDARDEIASIRSAIDLGVDVVMGGTHPDEALDELDGSSLRYLPFAGHVVGHPSVLQGAPQTIGANAATLTRRDGIHGIDLLAYRHRHDPMAVMVAVLSAVSLPVVVAGSIDSAARIATVCRLGAWGFTVGGAVFEGTFPAGPSVREQVEWVLARASQGFGTPRASAVPPPDAAGRRELSPASDP